MKKTHFFIASFLLLAMLFTVGCSSGSIQTIDEPIPEPAVTPSSSPEPAVPPSPAPEPEPLPDPAKDMLNSLTAEQKVAQLFLVSPEAITGSHSAHTAVNDELSLALQAYPVGGILFFGGNLKDAAQTADLISAIKDTIYGSCGIVPLLAVDEEGGSVARVASNKSFGVENVGDMREVGRSENPEKAYSAAEYIGSYLSELGFNLNFAPVADVFSNSANTVVKYRSFGSDPRLVSEMVLSQLAAYSSKNIIACPKHFPGHGSTGGDSHNGMTYTNKTWNELMDCELIPFVSAIDSGAQMIMIGHFSVPNVTGSNVPCSLSYEIITEKLKNELGYSGLVITDDLSMGAVISGYAPGQAAKAAFLAGADLLLLSDNFTPAYYAVLDAVNSGEISSERLNESVYKILSLKNEYR